MTTHGNLLIKCYNRYRICFGASILAFLLTAGIMLVAIYGYYSGKWIEQSGSMFALSLVPLVFGFILRRLAKRFGKCLMVIE